MSDPVDILIARLRRLYSRLGQVGEADLSKFPAVVLRSATATCIHQDFRGGMTDDDIADLINWILHHVAHLRNYLFKWAGSNEDLKSTIQDAVSTSIDIRLCIDLADNEKHGGPRGSGQSGNSPRLDEVDRVLQVRTGAERGSGAVISVDPRTGRLRTGFTGGAGATVVLTGRVVDGDGNVIGDVIEIVQRAMAAWEELLGRLGIATSTSSSDS